MARTSENDARDRAAFRRIKSRRHIHLTHKKTISHSHNIMADHLDLEKMMMDTGEGYSVIRPRNFGIKEQEVFSCLPLFNASDLSAGLAVHVSDLFACFTASAMRINEQLKTFGLYESEENVITWINGIARAFMHPLRERIRTDLLEHCDALVLDKAAHTISGDEDMTDGEEGKIHVWVLTSAELCRLRGTYFRLTTGCEPEDVVSILRSPKTTTKILTVDGFDGYEKAVEILRRDCGINIQILRSYRHLKETYKKFLNSEGLLEVYEKYLTCKDNKLGSFDRKVDAYTKKRRGRILLSHDIDLLYIFFCLDSLLEKEQKVIDKYEKRHSSKARQELVDERDEICADLVSELYKRVDHFVRKNPDIIEVVDTIAGTKYKGSRKGLARGIMPFLNHRNEIMRAMDNPHADLSSSAAGRILRNSRQQFREYEFEDFQDDKSVLADFMSVSYTCMNNDIDFSEYLIWYLANFKVRMHKLWSDGYREADIYDIPQPRLINESKRSSGGNGEEVVNMYDTNNITSYDRVDISGLMPYDYKKYIQNKKN